MQITLKASLEQDIAPTIQDALRTEFASRLGASDATLWGDSAVSEANVRLGWVSDPLEYTALVAELVTLRAELHSKGVTRVILAGMGGSSLGPEVMCAASGVPLVVVDTTHPNVLRPLIEGDVSDAVVVVSSKSGGTVETDSARRVFEEAFRAQNIDPRERIIVVTDPGSPLHLEATQAKYRVFPGNPMIGGRFSALSPFGLVPCALAGADMQAMLEDAHSAWKVVFADDETNPGLRLGAAMSVRAPQQSKLLLGDFDGLPGFGDWIEQLVAESTGKNGRGLLPVVGSSLSGAEDCLSIQGPGKGASIALEGGLGWQILVWEVATVFAAARLGVNPFDQPNVESAKIAARELLTSAHSSEPAGSPVDQVSLWSSLGLVGGLDQQLSATLARVGSDSYVALCIFGNSNDQEPWKQGARSLESSLGRPVTLGFGPRFLHSTGQFHKGGPATGVFIQVVEATGGSIPIPGREFDCEGLLVAQARGDARVLAETGQPVLSVTVTSHEARGHVLTALSPKG